MQFQKIECSKEINVHDEKSREDPKIEVSHECDSETLDQNFEILEFLPS